MRMYTIRDIEWFLGIGSKVQKDLCEKYQIPRKKMRIPERPKPVIVMDSDGLGKLMEAMGYVKVEYQGKTWYAYRKKMKEIK